MLFRSVAAWARAGVDLEGAVRDVADRGVKVHTLERYHVKAPSRPGVVIGYGVVDGAEIERGLAQLHQVLQG